MSVRLFIFILPAIILSALILSSCGAVNHDAKVSARLVTETLQSEDGEITGSADQPPLNQELPADDDGYIHASGDLTAADFEIPAPANNLAGNLTVTSHGIDTENAETAAVVADIKVFLTKYGADAGFLYYDISTGASLEYNADERFAAASIIKAPYARALLGSVFDLSKAYEMTEDLLNSPSEHIDGKPVGTFFSVEELILASIIKSDNTAFKMLYHYMGYETFNEYSRLLNIPHRMTDENYWFRLTARQTAVYFKDIYHFIERHPNGAILLGCLKSTQTDFFRSELTEYKTAGKYGYLTQEEIYTLGCASIIYADAPYILVGYIRGRDALNTGFFSDLARLSDTLHLIHHSNR